MEVELNIEHGLYHIHIKNAEMRIQEANEEISEYQEMYERRVKEIKTKYAGTTIRATITWPWTVATDDLDECFDEFCCQVKSIIHN